MERGWRGKRSLWMGQAEHRGFEANFAVDDGRVDFGREGLTVEWGVAAAGVEQGGVDGPVGIGVDQSDVGGCTRLESAGIEPEDAGGTDSEQFKEGRPVDVIGLNECFDADGEGGFQSADAAGCSIEFDLFLFEGTGLMIGGNGGDGAVLNTGDEGFDVIAGAEWRGALEHRVEGCEAVVGEQQVVGCDIGGNVDSVLSGESDPVDGIACGDAHDVDASASKFSEGDIATGHDVLGGSRYSAEAKSSGLVAFVHHATFGKFGDDGQMQNGAVEHAGVFECTAHDFGVGNGASGVREADGAAEDELSDFGELFTAVGFGDGTEWNDAAVAGAFGLEADEFGSGAGINNGEGIGLSGDGGKASGECSGGAGGGTFIFFVTGFAECDVQIDEARGDDQSVGIDPGNACWCRGRADGGDVAVKDEQISDFVAIGGGVNDAAAGNQE